jgi:hypothetical protein
VIAQLAEAPCYKPEGCGLIPDVVHVHVHWLVSVVKMATVMEECITEDQNSVVHFLRAKGLNAKDMHKEMFSVFGRKCLSHKAFHSWVEKFSQGCSKVTDDARPGHPAEITTEATVQQVEQLIQADRRITIL